MSDISNLVAYDEDFVAFSAPSYVYPGLLPVVAAPHISGPSTYDRSLEPHHVSKTMKMDTCWTANEAKRFGVEIPENVPMVTQERAYSSPIWYTP